jgi:hypothetical protein
MRHVIALIVGAMVILSGCGHGRVVRDADVYRAELDQYDRWAVRQAALLRDFVSSECACVDGRFETARCSDAADWLLTVETRHAWHHQMALLNAGLIEARPPASPPPIPPSACPLPPGPTVADDR